ncbi:MAG: hypothetical protein ACKVOW_16945, partial [Chitinophagaceae bacterium]
ASSWFKKWFTNKTAQDSLILEYLAAGFDIGDLLMQRYNYRNLVKQMYLQLNSGNDNSNINAVKPKDIFSLLYAINEECFIISKKDTSYRLLNYEDLRLMNKDELEIMFSLIDMKYGGSFSKLLGLANKPFELNRDDMNSLRRWLGGIENNIKQFQKIQEDFNRTQEELKNGKKEDAVYSLFNLWESVNTLFDMVIPDSTLKPAWMKGVDAQSDKIKVFTKKGFEVYNQISLKNYAGAVSSVISVLEDFFYNNNSTFTITENHFKDRLTPTAVNNVRKRETYPQVIDKGILVKYSYSKKINDQISIENSRVIESAIKAKRISKESVKKLSHSDSLAYGIKPFAKISNDTFKFKQTDLPAAILFERDRHAIQLIRKLAGFLNDVMLTTDSKKLAKVVESYALPPGSYKRKRNNWWSVDFNAYVGAFGGYEVATRNVGTSSLPPRIKGWVYGITAPIGVSLSKTFGRKLRIDSLGDALIRNPDKIRITKTQIKERGNATFTMTVSVVDLGAVVSYRFNNTKDSVLPQQVKWEQVFSPGISFAYGFRNTPLVISAGYQYTPRLRKIEQIADNPKNQQYNANRFQLGLLFDLPLANIWQRSFYPPRMKKIK